MQCCTKGIKTTLNKIFSYAILSWSISDNIALGFDLRNVVPRVLRRDWTGFFLTECCLEHLGQHCMGFCPVQCCPKSIKTTLNRIFSYTMLSEASQTTLHRALTCAMLSQEY